MILRVLTGNDGRGLAESLFHGTRPREGKVILLGLAANAGTGRWWADPLAALLMIPWLIKEGLEGLRGEDNDD